MNSFKRIALPCLVLAVIVPGIASAQSQPWHFGASAGLADINIDGFDEPVQLQGSFGYDVWQQSWGVLTAELTAGTSVSEGDIDAFGFDAEWDVTTVGVSATYRMSDLTFYPLASVGFQYADVTLDGPLGETGEDDTGLLVGIGAGIQMTESIALELSWNRQFDVIDEDLDIISLGVRF